MLGNNVRTLPVTAKGIAAARNGDEAAFGRLLEGYRQYLLLVANQELRADLRPKVAASDLVQETFLRAHHRFGSFSGRTADDLRAWLRCILMNYLGNVDRDFRNTGKRDLAREAAGEEIFAQGQDGGLACPRLTPSEELVARENDAELEYALAQLPHDYRQVIAWRNYETLSFEDIGLRLGRSAEAARKLWGRAIALLSTRLAQE